jgi:NADH-quinone oxidoreductase subunit A
VRPYLPLLVVLLSTCLVVALGYGVSALLAVRRLPLTSTPFLSGGELAEHAMSRYHARWYAMSLLFLAFDVEMLFMYPWALVVAQVGTSSIVEMFGFLLVLLAGVLYAWREGVLRWS